MYPPRKIIASICPRFGPKLLYARCGVTNRPLRLVIVFGTHDGHQNRIPPYVSMCLLTMLGSDHYVLS